MARDNRPSAHLYRDPVPISLQQLERHVFKAAEILRGKMSKAMAVKLGLMNDLLTGHARITPSLTQERAA